MNSEQLHRDLEQLLELDTYAITGSENLRDLSWDSMAVISFIAMMSGNYGIAIPVSKLKEAATVADLAALINAGGN